VAESLYGCAYYIIGCINYIIIIIIVFNCFFFCIVDARARVSIGGSLS
jgi:bacteriorhodopsin